MNTSYLFELQQNVVHSSVSITSEQNRFAATHQHTDQAGDGGGLARAGHAQYQCIVVSSQGFGHRLLLPRVQLLKDRLHRWIRQGFLTSAALGT